MTQNDQSRPKNVKSITIKAIKQIEGKSINIAHQSSITKEQAE